MPQEATATAMGIAGMLTTVPLDWKRRRINPRALRTRRHLTIKYPRVTTDINTRVAITGLYSSNPKT